MNLNNVKFIDLINESKKILNIYKKLNICEIKNDYQLFTDTLTKLKYEVKLEECLYDELNHEDMIYISEFLNNYRFASEDSNSIWESILNKPMNDLIVDRIKAKLTSRLLNESHPITFNNYYDETADSIIKNCSDNFKFNNDELSYNELIIMLSLINKYQKDFINILCNQIDNIKNEEVKKKLIQYKYNYIFDDDMIEEKMLTTKNALLDSISLNTSFTLSDYSELNNLIENQKDNLFDTNFQLDLKKIVEFLYENKNSKLYNIEKAILYSMVRANIEIYGENSYHVCINQYINTIEDMHFAQDITPILEIFNDIENNLGYDNNVINSIRIKKIK